MRDSTHQPNHNPMHSMRVLALGALFVLAGCKGAEQTKPADSSPSAAPTAAGPSGEVTPAPGGKVVVVEMVTDETSSRFSPSEFEVHKGDVIRYTLKVGVHNVDFYPDSNAVKMGLPPTSEMLQLPGQTHDMLVTMEPGTYYFHCDPHAALGMKGHVTVVQ
jgi:plastocyanin